MSRTVVVDLDPVEANDVAQKRLAKVEEAAQQEINKILQETGAFDKIKVVELRRHIVRLQARRTALILELEKCEKEISVLTGTQITPIRPVVAPAPPALPEPESVAGEAPEAAGEAEPSEPKSKPKKAMN